MVTGNVSMAKITSCFKQLSPALLPTYRCREAIGHLRQTIALPVYTLGLLMNYLSAALGRLAAKIAGDDWP